MLVVDTPTIQLHSIRMLVTPQTLADTQTQIPVVMQLATIRVVAQIPMPVVIRTRLRLVRDEPLKTRMILTIATCTHSLYTPVRYSWHA